MKTERMRKIIDSTRAGRILFRPEICAVQEKKYFFLLSENFLLDDRTVIKYIENRFKI